MATTAPDRRTALRRVFAQSQVRAYLIVMCRIRKNLPQLCLSKNRYRVQALGTHTATLPCFAPPKNSLRLNDPRRAERANHSGNVRAFLAAYRDAIVILRTDDAVWVEGGKEIKHPRRIASGSALSCCAPRGFLIFVWTLKLSPILGVGAKPPTCKMFHCKDHSAMLLQPGRV
jgi:hypothetical protein